MRRFFSVYIIWQSFRRRIHERMFFSSPAPHIISSGNSCDDRVLHDLPLPHEPEFRRRRGTQPVAHVFQRHASAAVLQQHDRSRRNRPAAHHKLFLRVFAFMNNIISASCRLDKNLFSAIIVILSSSNCCIRSPRTIPAADETGYFTHCYRKENRTQESLNRKRTPLRAVRV